MSAAGDEWGELLDDSEGDEGNGSYGPAGDRGAAALHKSSIHPSSLSSSSSSFYDRDDIGRSRVEEVRRVYVLPQQQNSTTNYQCSPGNHEPSTLAHVDRWEQGSQRGSQKSYISSGPFGGSSIARSSQRRASTRSKPHKQILSASKSKYHARSRRRKTVSDVGSMHRYTSQNSGEKRRRPFVSSNENHLPASTSINKQARHGNALDASPSVSCSSSPSSRSGVKRARDVRHASSSRSSSRLSSTSRVNVSNMLIPGPVGKIVAVAMSLSKRRSSSTSAKSHQPSSSAHGTSRAPPVSAPTPAPPPSASSSSFRSGRQNTKGLSKIPSNRASVDVDKELDIVFQQGPWLKACLILGRIPPFGIGKHPLELQKEYQNKWLYSAAHNEFNIARVHTSGFQSGINGNNFPRIKKLVVVIDQIYSSTGTVELRVRDETGFAMATVQDQAAEAYAGQILVGSVLCLENVVAWRNTLPRPEENALFEGMDAPDPDVDYSQFYLNITDKNLNLVISAHESVPHIFLPYTTQRIASQTSSISSPSLQSGNSDESIGNESMEYGGNIQENKNGKEFTNVVNDEDSNTRNGGRVGKDLAECELPSKKKKLGVQEDVILPQQSSEHLRGQAGSNLKNVAQHARDGADASSVQVVTSAEERRRRAALEFQDLAEEDIEEVDDLVYSETPVSSRPSNNQKEDNLLVAPNKDLTEEGSKLAAVDELLQEEDY